MDAAPASRPITLIITANPLHFQGDATPANTKYTAFFAEAGGPNTQFYGLGTVEPNTFTYASILWARRNMPEGFELACVAGDAANREVVELEGLKFAEKLEGS